MNWVRVATKMKGDPSIGKIAADCKVRVEHAVGLVCCVLMEFPDHARDGDTAAIPDVVLEQWAMWSGKAGTFAAAFRAHLCDNTGLVRAWDRHNGNALRKAESDIERKRAAREQRENGAKTARAESAPSARQNTARRQNGQVDETRRDVTTTPEAGVAVSARDAERPPVADHPVAYRQQLDDLRAAGLPHERAALDALLAHHPSPDVLVLELHATASGLHVVRGVNTGRAADIADVMRAVAEMAASAKPFSVSLFRGFARRVADRPPEPASAEEREAARLAREIAARQPAVVVEKPRTDEEREALRVQREAAMAQFRAEFQRYNPQPVAA
jgi:hypothetical protein